MAVLPKASLAVTVTLWATPAVVGVVKPETVRVVAVLESTEMALWVPVMVPVTVSVAVIDWVPAVLSVAEKVWVPRRRRRTCSWPAGRTPPWPGRHCS